MTDREALEELLRRFGLTPYAGKLDGGPVDENTVALMAKEGGVEGYSGFVALFDFDTDGKFKTLGIYE